MIKMIQKNKEVQMGKSIMVMILVAGFLLSSCDKLKEPYATLKKSGGDTTKTSVRKVLLEDYTGHLCVNCPIATMNAHVLEQSSGGQLIIIQVHAGNLAASSDPPFTADYTCSAGAEWYNTFGIYANPLGLVNRKPYKGSLIVFADQWVLAVDTLIGLPPDALVNITNSYNAASQTLTSVISTKFKTLLTGSYSLCACITEDSLVSAQKNNDTLAGPVPIINNYVFLDVLRGTLNGTWGDTLTTSVDTTRTYNKTFVLNFPAAWVPKNCHVVSFVFNTSTKEIIQTEKTGVLETKK